MRICMVAEGCYPYVVGGVALWIDSIIRSFPEYDFVILAIVADRSMRGKFAYELPENVREVHELYINDVEYAAKKGKGRTRRLGKKEYRALQSLIMGHNVDWETLFALFQQKDLSIDRLAMGPDFFHAVQDFYDLKYPQIPFTDFLWSMRSMYLPLFFTMRMELPKADLYHCTATGYAGVLGAMAKHFYGCPLMISEHGIYTREREQEILTAKWLKDIYKNIWIEQFRKISTLGYERADLVTCLYEDARELQIELGCSASKIQITPNGIDVARFENLAGRTEEDELFVNIGAVLRVSPIKDVKTLIQAFALAKEREPDLKLWIMGPWDENREYAQECFEMVEAFRIPDVVFTGRIDVRDYLGRMDMTILTSISEGQPLTILESFAAHCPVIATNVGNCRGLILGEGDDTLGAAGIVTHIMNVEEITGAMIRMARHPDMRRRMGEVGYQRVMDKYRIERMQNLYYNIYREFEAGIGTEPRQELDTYGRHRS